MNDGKSECWEVGINIMLIRVMEKVLLICFMLFFSTCGHLLIKEDATLFSGHFEGDLVGVNDKNKQLVNVQKWPNAEIHYEVDVNLNFKTRRAIRKAMLEIQRKSCIRFSPKEEDTKDYITFVDRRGCTAHLGNVGGAMEMSVGVGCDEVGIMLHELMHVLGFWHENSRLDRDYFVLVNWDNVPLQYQKYFSAYTQPKESHMGERYDIASVTHMSRHAFAKDKKVPVLMPKDERYKISERIELSPGDVNKIKRLYCGMAIPRFDPPKIENLARPEMVDVEEAGISEATDVETRLISVENPCSDRLTKCPFWAVQGQCYKRKEFMETNCKYSCLLCPTPTPCRNFNTLCSLWKRLGNCEKRKIMENCPLECNICYIEDLDTHGPDTARDVSPVSTCADYHFKCNEEATARECLFSDIVQRLCPRTCNRCDLFISGNSPRQSSHATHARAGHIPSSSSHQPSRNGRTAPLRRSQTMPAGWRRCVDHNENCARWARRRRCRWSHVWSQCRKSCGFCQDDDEINESEFGTQDHAVKKYRKLSEL